MQVVESDIDGLECGEVPLPQGYTITWQKMGENDVPDVTGGPETPDSGTGRKEGIEIVPCSKVEDSGEEPGLPQCEDEMAVHLAPGLGFERGGRGLGRGAPRGGGIGDGFLAVGGEGGEGAVVEGGGGGIRAGEGRCSVGVHAKEREGSHPGTAGCILVLLDYGRLVS